MSFIRGRTATAMIMAAAIAGGLSACKKNDQYASGDTTAARADSAAGSAAAAAMSDSAKSDSAKSDSLSKNSGWSDAKILGYVTAANDGEVALGKLGETKATNAAVRAFARQMVTDHSAMQKDTKALGTKVSVMADSTADVVRDLTNGARDDMKDLMDKTKGADWDKDYMDKMIDGHQKVLDKLQDAAKNTTNTDLRNALEKATGKVQAHLTKAQDIKSKQLKA